MRFLLLSLMFGLLAPLAIADSRAETRTGPEVLQHCEVRADAYKHTGLGYPISRVDWGFMSIDVADFVFHETLCFGQAASALNFIAQSYDQLERELAQGFGPYTQNMLTLLGCDPDDQRPLMSQVRPAYGDYLQATHAAGSPASEQAQAYFELLVTADRARGCTGVMALVDGVR